MTEVDYINDFEPVDDVSAGLPTPSSTMGNPRRNQSPASDRLKHAVDAVLAFVALIVLLPMMLTVSVVLLMTQGRPVLIGHRRIGKGGHLFPCFKFRTMVINGDEVLKWHLDANPEFHAEWNATRKLKEDPRVTAFGRSLRRSSIDELPQLLNVIRGEMSLVGPRPITQSETEYYGQCFQDYARVRPGLTGLWQVSGRSNTSYKERVEFDIRYVAEHSIFGDFVIMAKTIPAILRSHGSY
jgi:exopolysaccharide production protein ExoY